MEQNHTNKPSERLALSNEAIVFIRESLAEIKSDIKEQRRSERERDEAINERFEGVEKTLQEIKTQMIHQRWKTFILAVSGGGVGALGVMKSGILVLLKGP